MPSRQGPCPKLEAGRKQQQQQQAIMVNGQRYTCEKCRKGHRTGTCNHLVDDDGNPSLLQKTNRAGRPNTTSKCRCPSSDRCTCVKTWYLVVRIPKSEIEPGREGENNCRIVGTVVRPLREKNNEFPAEDDGKYGGTLIASSTASSGHRCTCGDTCACTYCPEHPENQATHAHNAYLANQNRPSASVEHTERQLVESTSQSCGGTAEVSYACSSDNTAAGQEAMLSTIPLNDQRYHYQVYSGQYPHGGCARSCRCPGCITWRVVPSVKQLLLASGYMHEDCPPKCNCPGCWTYRERGGFVDFPILTTQDFFSPLDDDNARRGEVITPTAVSQPIGISASNRILPNRIDSGSHPGADAFFEPFSLRRPSISCTNSANLFDTYMGSSFTQTIPHSFDQRQNLSYESQPVQNNSLANPALSPISPGRTFR